MANLNIPNRPPFPAQDLSLEQRRQAALAFAKQSEQILRSEFGAEQVTLFGFLTGGSPWHCQSDLDLAITGLSHSGWLKACSYLEAIAPLWLKIDLVRLETVDPPVGARILKEKPMPSNLYLALKEQLSDELIALERSTQALAAALERAKPDPEDSHLEDSHLEDYDIRALEDV